MTVRLIAESEYAMIYLFPDKGKRRTVNGATGRSMTSKILQVLKAEGQSFPFSVKEFKISWIERCDPFKLIGN